MTTPASHKRTFALLLLLALVGGATSGIVATVMVNTALNEYAAALLSGRRPGSSNTPSRPSVSTYEDTVQTVRTVAEASVVAVTRSALNSRLASSWVNEHQALGYGVVVSADGWILVRAETFADITNALRETEIWIDGVRYEPMQYVADALTDFALVKVEARGLSPVAFAASEEVGAGKQVFAVATGESLFVTTVSDTRVPVLSNVLPAEAFAYAWKFAEALPSVQPVFTGEGQLLALGGSGTALPVHYGSAFIKEVIRSNEPAHAGLGAYVVDLSAVLNLDPTLRQDQDRGALIAVPASGASAILRVSPANTAGLLVGDIVTAVDGVRVDHRHTLAEILRLYDPGESAAFTIMRAGKEQTITITFVNYDDLLY